MAVAGLSADAQGESTVRLPMGGPVCAEASADQSAVKRRIRGIHEIQAPPNRQFWENPQARLRSSYVPRYGMRRAVTDGTRDALRS